MRPLHPILIVACCAFASGGQKFYSDDPLEREPAPSRVDKATPRKISDVYDLFSHVLSTPGEKHSVQRRIAALDVNTLGEVLEGSWYEKRHARRRMSLEQLAAGPGNSSAPADGEWSILSAKSEGVTPGFLIRDSHKRLYFLKFDPIGNPELATAADVISSKFFYALGYHVPENYIVYFERSRLKLNPGVQFRDAQGRKRSLTSRDMGEILNKVPRDSDGRIRATASRVVPGAPLGPFRYFGTRSDDPNDIVPHEHRRSLRGLHTFCAWLGHEDSRAINSLDTLVDDPGGKHVRHFLIDFGSTLGSASTKVNSPRSGFEQFFTWRSTAKEFFSLGLYVPRWSTIDYPNLPSVGRFSSEFFDPRQWTPEYPNPAFNNRLPADAVWAAEQVMEFSDDEIRAMVKTGRYSNPEAEKYVGDVLIRRRDAIGRAYLSRPGTPSRIRLDGDHIAFSDLATRHRFTNTAPAYRYKWFVFDNATGKKTPVPGAETSALPRNSAQYLAVDIDAGNESPRVTVYLRQVAAGYQVVGIDRVS
jgi:hypothetical protein